MAAPTSPDYCFVWINHWSTCMTKAEWAAWMAVVTSTISILAGVAIISWQLRVNAKRDRDLQFESLKYVDDLLAMSSELLRRMEKEADQEANRKDLSNKDFYLRQWQEIAEPLSAVDMKSVPMGRVRRSFVDGRTYARRAAEIFAKGRAHFGADVPDDIWPGELKQLMSIHANTIDEKRKDIEKWTLSHFGRSLKA